MDLRDHLENPLKEEILVHQVFPENPVPLELQEKEDLLVNRVFKDSPDYKDQLEVQVLFYLQ